MRKSATTITKETSSPYIVAEFIPPRLDTENEENGKKTEEEHPRKGHKPFCRYRDCQCAECQMVEKRRRLNNALNTRKPGEGKLKGLMGGINLGPKARNPMCARCTAHGKESALRGHKKAVCPFRICECEKCGLVEERRRLMAAQIKLRRRQKKAREGGTDDGSIEDEEFCEILNSSSSPLIGINKELNNTKMNLTKQQKKPRQQYKPRKQWNNSNNFLIESKKELNFGGGPQIPPINLIQPPQQPFDTAAQTNLQTLQTLNFMRLNNLAENSKAMETEEENEDDNRKRATASEGIQQLSDR
uniref:DM domain-containing protein n=1 Tax=Meloidogyne javanica TaxID=6303 RepID=A0A915MNU4_MELJA